MSEAKQQAQFLQIYEDLSDAIFRHCFFRLRDREKARDTTQETFLRYWRSIQEGKVIDNPRAFLYKIATNLIIDASRRQTSLSLEQLEEGVGFEPGEDDSERQQNFLDGAVALAKLEELDPKYRDAVYLRYVDQLSPGEIAKVMGANEGTVSVWIHRGIERLRELLNHE
jgi:RNA polymerase sigma factor (sigma-70 family)